MKKTRFFFLFLLLTEMLNVGIILAEEQENPIIYDFVIVGGGVSGTYCAWRLSNQSKEISDKRLSQVPQKMCLMESSNRIGGRLFSIALPELPDMHAELGGMRILSMHENVFGLVKYLGLHPEFFGSAENITYLRRVRFEKEDLMRDSAKVPYNLREDEKGKSSHELILLGLNKAFPELQKMNQMEVKEYLKTAKYKGTPLWEIGYWNLLMNELSIEAYHFITDAGGYYSSVSNWNAYDAIVSYSKYYQDLTFYKVKEGLDSLPKKLANLFVENGGNLCMNTEVISLLKEKIGDEDLIKIQFRKEGTSQLCYAKHVILALPKRAIELFDQNSFFFSNQSLVQDLKRVTAEHASKVFLWYDEAWWTRLGLSNGPSRTDLPLRQCYYFGNEKSSMQKLGKGLLMASYSDGVAVDYWEGYFKDSAFDRVRENYVDEASFIKRHFLPERMLVDLTNQLSELHGITVPKAQKTLFKNWNEDPYGGGWHAWNPHNQSWLVIPRLRHPIKEANLYICGESYSSNQGWIEGALNSAENLLEENFNLSRPAWITPEYDLGP